jgi:hypothetical protein
VSKGLTQEMQDAAPPSKKLAILRAEMEARLAALEGGAPWGDPTKHGTSIKWLAGEIWELERIVKGSK